MEYKNFKEALELDTIKIAGAIAQIKQTITNSDLAVGEKFLLTREVYQAVKPIETLFASLEKDIKEWAKNNLIDSGVKASNTVIYEGVEVFVKYAYPKPKIDGAKALNELEKAYTELNAKLDLQDYLVESTPTKTVIIQAPLTTLK